MSRSFRVVDRLCVLLLFIRLSLAAVGSDRSAQRGGHGLKPDKFVQASPLIVAAVCRDGVAVITAHTSDQDEPLLYYSHEVECGQDGEEDEDNKPSQSSKSTTTSQSSELPYLDLPRDYAGPLRIHAIDAYGTTMLACGWRSDCDALVARARALAAAQVRRYGPPAAGSISYAKYMTSEVSLHMVQCALSDRVSSARWVAIFRTVNGTGDVPLTAESLLTHSSLLLAMFCRLGSLVASGY
jgi:hypothetical protein